MSLNRSTIICFFSYFVNKISMSNIIEQHHISMSNITWVRSFRRWSILNCEFFENNLLNEAWKWDLCYWRDSNWFSHLMRTIENQRNYPILINLDHFSYKSIQFYLISSWKLPKVWLSPYRAIWNSLYKQKNVPYRMTFICPEFVKQIPNVLSQEFLLK